MAQGQAGGGVSGLQDCCWRLQSPSRSGDFLAAARRSRLWPMWWAGFLGWWLQVVGQSSVL